MQVFSVQAILMAIGKFIHIIICRLAADFANHFVHDESHQFRSFLHMASINQPPLKVCVTGAAGQIAYSLLPHICLGRTFGADRRIILHLMDIERAQTVQYPLTSMLPSPILSCLIHTLNLALNITPFV